MKKIGILLLILFLALAGVFAWLVLEASPDNAPDEVITIELPDTYER